MLKKWMLAALGLGLLSTSALAADGARVVVLKWPGSELSYEDSDVQRVVKSRIARADAVFAPSVDLFQNGRRHPNRGLNAAGQPARVGPANLDAVKREVERVAQIAWNQQDENQWANEARVLKDLIDQIWFVESPEQREGLFALYAQAGRAAWYQGSEAPPFFEAIGGTAVNYYHYLAAVMAKEDPSLMGSLGDQELHSYISQYLDMLNGGQFPTMPLDFELENQFDLDAFSKQYKVFLNGLEVVPNANGQVLVPLGRTDIYLQAADGGSGLSERLVVDKLEDKAFFVRDVARKSMGIDFIDVLMKHPNECSPELEERMHVYLSIYAKLHPNEDVYIAVPEEGRVNKLRIWRFDRQGSTLQLVGGGDGDFPVRFGGVLASGTMWNTAMAVIDSSQVEPGELTGTTSLEDRAGVELGSSHIPVNAELRVHYNRLMAAVGLEAGFHMGDGWTERYKGSDGRSTTLVDPSDPCITGGAAECTEVLRTETLNVMPYISVGVLLGKDAGIGIGPRAAVRFGQTTVPHANVLTLHGGYSQFMPGVESSGRVRPFIDADFRVGMVLPQTGSLQLEGDGGLSQPTFGLTAGVGTTF